MAYYNDIYDIFKSSDNSDHKGGNTVADYDDIFDIFRSSGRKAYIRSLVPELIEEKEQPEKVDGSTSDEDDEHLERRIERLDALFDRANDFFERAEDAVDRIGDGICSLLGLDEEEPDPEPERRFPMIVGGIDADLTDKYLDEFEDKIYFLSDMYKGCAEKKIPFEPYTFDESDEEYARLFNIPAAENGYDRQTVSEYVSRLKSAAEKEWREMAEKSPKKE